MSQRDQRPARLTVFAPATVANVSVGFDVLGFALEVVGDRVTVTRTRTPGVSVRRITGVVPDLPLDPRRNTASVAVQALVDAAAPDAGFEIEIDKGISLGSGMGGSAASAVGGVVAANALLDAPLPTAELLPFAAAGEAAASGAPHADNAAPCLFGGLAAVVSADPLRVVRIPLPASLLCVLVHPHLIIETRAAREVLRSSISLKEHVQQSMRLCGFLAGCHAGDLGLIGRSMVDTLVEPQRSTLIPGFAAARDAARGAGAIGFGIAGSGPSVFAWVSDRAVAERVATAVQAAFADADLATDAWVSPIAARGARVVAES